METLAETIYTIMHKNQFILSSVSSLGHLIYCPSVLSTRLLHHQRNYFEIFFCTIFVFGFFPLPLFVFSFFLQSLSRPYNPVPTWWIVRWRVQIWKSSVWVRSWSQTRLTGTCIYIKPRQCLLFNMSSSAKLENETTDCKEQTTTWFNALFSCWTRCPALEMVFVKGH